MPVNIDGALRDGAAAWGGIGGVGSAASAGSGIIAWECLLRVTSRLWQVADMMRQLKTSWVKVRPAPRSDKVAFAGKKSLLLLRWDLSGPSVEGSGCNVG